MNRVRLLLPAITSASAGLGALMYAGTKGYDCVGRYDNRPIAHPPLPWPWYIALAAVTVGISLVPLLLAKRAA
jgi:hypothetical protein